MAGKPNIAGIQLYGNKKMEMKELPKVTVTTDVKTKEVWKAKINMYEIYYIQMIKHENAVLKII